MVRPNQYLRSRQSLTIITLLKNVFSTNQKEAEKARKEAERKAEKRKKEELARQKKAVAEERKQLKQKIAEKREMSKKHKAGNADEDAMALALSFS